jgi:hypothetical protein
MTELDKAHAALKANPDDPGTKMDFYLLFLNSIFFVPIKKVDDSKNKEKKVELPLIIENEGHDFLVFFDQQERLNNWAGKHVHCAQMPGFALVAISSPEIYWAMNVGTEQDRQFAPEEIAWLKGVLAMTKGSA